jgi:hypothetical protein
LKPLKSKPGFGHSPLHTFYFLRSIVILSPHTLFGIQGPAFWEVSPSIVIFNLNILTRLDELCESSSLLSSDLFLRSLISKPEKATGKMIVLFGRVFLVIYKVTQMIMVMN